MLYCARCGSEAPVTSKIYEVHITGSSPYRDEKVMTIPLVVCRPCHEAGWIPKSSHSSLQKTRWKNEQLYARCVHENKIEFMVRIEEGVDPFAKPAPKKKAALKK